MKLVTNKWPGATRLSIFVVKKTVTKQKKSFVKGSFYFGPSEKKPFLLIFYEITNKDIDIESVRLNKNTLEIHVERFFHLFSTLFMHKNVSQTRRLEK